MAPTMRAIAHSVPQVMSLRFVFAKGVEAGGPALRLYRGISNALHLKRRASYAISDECELNKQNGKSQCRRGGGYSERDWSSNGWKSDERHLKKTEDLQAFKYGACSKTGASDCGSARNSEINSVFEVAR